MSTYRMAKRDSGSAGVQQKDSVTRSGKASMSAADDGYDSGMYSMSMSSEDYNSSSSMSSESSSPGSSLDEQKQEAHLAAKYEQKCEPPTLSSRPTTAADMDSYSRSNSIPSAETDYSDSYLRSSTDAMYSSSMDSGLGSMSLTPTTVASLSDTDSSYPYRSRKSTTSSNSDNEKSLFMGTLPEFLVFLTTVAVSSDSRRQYKWESWDPVKHIKNCLTPELLKQARELIWGQDEDKEFEMLNAARDQDENLVAFGLFIAVSHKQLNTMNEDRQTVLHIAAQNCSPQLVRLLITRGCDGAIADVWGDTPLHIAARCGRGEVIKMLATTLTKPEVHHPYFRVPYKSLPQDNVQSFNHDGRTPVHLAAQEPHSPAHVEALRALVKYARADIDYRRLGDGYAPAHIAIDNDDITCLRKCLELGADSEVRNFKSETPQQLAFLCERPNMVELCQTYGAGSYQLLYAKTEPVSDDEDMEVDDEAECEQATRESNLLRRMERMAVG